MRTSFPVDALARFALAVAALLTLLALARTAFGDSTSFFGDDRLDADTALGFFRGWIVVAAALSAVAVMASDLGRPERSR